MHSSLVSIIVPVFNVADYLDACMESILEQSHRDIEVILINDASQDRSSEICDHWATRDNRIKVIHFQENQGSSAARNAGLDSATGTYIMFVDSDDLIAPDLVAHMIEIADPSGAQAVVTNWVKLESGRAEFTESSGYDILPAAEALHRIVCVKPQWEPWAKLFAADLFRGLRFPTGLVHQDLFLTPRLFTAATTAAMSDAKLYGYRERAGSIMHQRKKIASPDLLTILDENIQFAKSTRTGVRYQEFLTAYLTHASKRVSAIALGKPWSANSEFITAYRVFAKKHRREMVVGARLRRAQKALWLLSSHSPLAFRLAGGSARTLKRMLLPSVPSGDSASPSKT